MASMEQPNENTLKYEKELFLKLSIYCVFLSQVILLVV